MSNAAKKQLSRSDMVLMALGVSGIVAVGLTLGSLALGGTAALHMPFFRITAVAGACLTTSSAGLYFLIRLFPGPLSRAGRRELASLRAIHQRVVDNTPSGVVCLDTKGQVVVWNAYMEKRFRIPADEVIGRDLAEAIPSLETEGVIAAVESVLAGGPPVDFNRLAHQTKRLGERVIDVAVQPILNPDAEVIGAALFVLDRTVEARTEEALRTANDWLRLHLDTMESGVFAVDSERQITSFNPAASRLTGYTAEEVIGLPCSVIHDGSCQTNCPLLDPDGRERIANQECTLRTKDGRTIIASKSTGILRDADGKVLGVVESFQDITQRKAMERQLRERNAELEQRNREITELNREMEEANKRLREIDRMKDAFFANMSHELRTPLNGIIGFAQLLLDGLLGKLDDGQTEAVGRIHSAGQHLLALINDILDITKIAAGQGSIDPEPLPCDAVVHEAISCVEPLLEKKQQSLEVSVEEGLPNVYADPLRIRQILLNLLSNANKFTPEGGTIRTNVARHDEQMIRFTVSDSGIGIAPEFHEVIFDEFRQVPKPTKDKPEGTGLGLAICRKLVEMHGGRMWVVSNLGEGATFSFTMPIAGEADEQEQPDAPAAQRPEEVVASGGRA